MEPCFGTIYPDLQQFRFNQEISGKVFQMRIDTRGPGHRDKHLSYDTAAWDQCRQCDLFQSCFDFSNAKLAMQQAMN